MVDIHLAQRHIRYAILHRGHKTPTLTLGLQLLSTSLKVGIQCRQLLPEVIHAALKVLVRHKQVLLYVGLFHLVASLAGQDHQLANHVGTTQVDTWVGLAVALLLGTSYGLRERHVGSYLVKYKVQRTTQYSLDFQDLITRVTQVVDGADDRQTSAHVGLVTEPHTTVASRLLQLHIVSVIARSRQFIGCNHADVMLQERLVQRCNILAGGTIHKHAIKNVHANHLVA